MPKQRLIFVSPIGWTGVAEMTVFQCSNPKWNWGIVEMMVFLVPQGIAGMTVFPMLQSRVGLGHRRDDGFSRAPVQGWTGASQK